MTAPEDLKAVFGRMREVAQISSASAASAISTMLGSELHAHEPRVRAATIEEMGAGATGVIFEMDGAVQGLIAIFLPPKGAESVIDMLCPGIEPDSAMAHSALREVGNVVASHAVSSVADHLGATITISVPILVGESVDDAFGSLLFERRAGAAGYASEIDLCEPAGSRRALLVFAPDDL